MAVTVAVAGAETPVAYAVSVETPVFVPSVTVVVATPDSSEMADDGAKLIPPPPLAKKFTTLPATALPLASATLTAKAPMTDRTAADVVGDVATVTLLAGPIFGPDESPPHAATRLSDAAAARNTRGWRITWSAR
jgi:hypothetical protein